MKLEDIRKRMAYNPCALPTQKAAVRIWQADFVGSYPIALTLTLKQHFEVKTALGTYIKKLDRTDCQYVAKRFIQKLNREVFGHAATRYGKTLKYLAVIEGERSGKALHLHFAIGDLPAHIRFNQVSALVERAKSHIDTVDKQCDVDITDSGWMDYITKELGSKDSDNVLWDLT